MQNPTHTHVCSRPLLVPFAGAEGAQKGGVGVCRWRTLEMLQMAYVGRLGLMPPMPRLERLTLHDSLNAQV